MENLCKVFFPIRFISDTSKSYLFSFTNILQNLPIVLLIPQPFEEHNSIPSLDCVQKIINLVWGFDCSSLMIIWKIKSSSDFF